VSKLGDRLKHFVFGDAKGDKYPIITRGGSRGRLGRSPPIIAIKVTLFTIILYNSENSIRDKRPLFCHSSVAKYTSSLLQ